MNLMRKYQERFEASLHISDRSMNSILQTTGRRASLQMVMDATIHKVKNEIINVNVWELKEETRKIERELADIQRDVLEDKGKLIDFAEACQRWKRSGTRGVS